MVLVEESFDRELIILTSYFLGTDHLITPLAVGAPGSDVGSEEGGLVRVFEST